MTFRSILFPGDESEPPLLPSQPPSCFRDLNLDALMSSLLASKQAYGLEPFFQVPLQDAASVRYRQEVMRDLDGTALMEDIRRFATAMAEVRELLERSRKLSYPYEQARWFLGAAQRYCQGVQDLLHGLRAEHPASEGLRSLRACLEAYATSEGFLALTGETDRVIGQLDQIQFCLFIRNSSITVKAYDGEADYGAEVEATFEKFRTSEARDYRVKFNHWIGLNHVEAQILDRVALLHREAFHDLEAFQRNHADFQDPTLQRFDREVQFYVAYLDFIAPLRSAGLVFTLPEVSEDAKEERVIGAFDLALARQIHLEQGTVVCNDFTLEGPERIFVVSGPNQGGKTTFARMVGQLHHLAGLGCPVPGKEARLFLADRIFTHFERAEDLSNLRGKLQDDLLRIRHILDEATPRSLVILNEIFASTTLKDAVFLGRQILARLLDLDALGVCVTFLAELAGQDPRLVSLVSMVDPEDPAIRTYRLVRKPADGQSYALVLARKHRLTPEQIKERIRV